MVSESVFRSCLQGLSQWRRYEVGGTRAAVEFAEAVVGHREVDAVTAVEAVEAQILIAARHVDVGDTREVKIARLLWGGDDGWEWCERIVEAAAQPPAVPVAAERGTSGPDFERLADGLFSIDDRAIGELEAAFWVAFRQALRQATASARRANRTMSVAAQTNAGLVGDDLDQARARIRAAGPFDGWAAAGDRVLAAIDADLERAVESALEDYEEVAAGILRRAVARAVRLVASVLGVAQDDVAGFGSSESEIREAAGFARGWLLDWVRARLAGDRDGEDLPELDVPVEVFRDTVGIAGGAVLAGRGLGRAAGGVAVDADQGLVGESVGGRLVDRVLGGVSSGVVTAAGLAAGLRVGRSFRWSYGDRGDRVEPFEPHFRLDGRTWVSGEDGPGYFPGDHRGCQCRVKRVWSVVR